MKDPSSANLDRIQVIKGWTKNGQSFEKIYDVAWSGDRKPDKWSGRVPAMQSTVGLEKATYTNRLASNSGSVQAFLSSVEPTVLLSCGNILDITDAEPLAGHRILCMDISMS